MADKKKKNFMKTTVLLFLALSFFEQALGDFTVISVIRTLPLTASEKALKDYYVNAGTNNGLLKGAVIEALRKVSVFDNLNSKLSSDTLVPVAKLKIIHVDKSVAIARLVEMYDAKITPSSIASDVIVGDLVRVAEKQ